MYSVLPACSVAEDRETAHELSAAGDLFFRQGTDGGTGGGAEGQLDLTAAADSIEIHEILVAAGLPDHEQADAGRGIKGVEGNGVFIAEALFDDRQRLIVQVLQAFLSGIGFGGGNVDLEDGRGGITGAEFALQGAFTPGDLEKGVSFRQCAAKLQAVELNNGSAFRRSGGSGQQQQGAVPAAFKQIFDSFFAAFQAFSKFLQLSSNSIIWPKSFFSL